LGKDWEKAKRDSKDAVGVGAGGLRGVEQVEWKTVSGRGGWAPKKLTDREKRGTWEKTRLGAT